MKKCAKAKKKPLRIWLLQFFFLHFIDWAEALAKNLKTWKKIRMIAKSIHIIRGIFFALFVTNYAYKDDDIVSHGTLRNTSSRDLSQIICAKKTAARDFSRLELLIFPQISARMLRQHRGKHRLKKPAELIRQKLIHLYKFSHSHGRFSPAA